MKIISRTLKVLGILVLILILLASGGGYLFVQRTLPQMKGTVHLTGLKGQVEIIRDRWGVPHIFAQNQEDLFFAQGYVHAQDRLWQMEFNRRVAAGRLSEVLGKATVETDIYLRTLGLYRAAQADAAILDPETKAVLEAYARGVNAFIATHEDSLPPEFTLLGFKPAPWSPVDTLGWGKVMALNLSGNMDNEIWRAQAIAKLGEARLAELEPGYPASGPFIVEEMAKTGGITSAGTANSTEAAPWLQALDPKSLAALQAQNDALPSLLLSYSWPAAMPKADPAAFFALGSNNWVVSGARTQSGKPLLANDPHLGIQMPSIWYEIHLSGGGLDVIGVSFPGVPGVIIGHNQRIAWGVTNVGPDVQDLYIEKVNPQNPKQVEFKGQWEDVQVFAEEIKVKGESSRTIEVLVTRHGPVVTPIIKGMTQTLALRWTALEPGTIFRSVRLLNQAQNWEQFRAALAYWDVPSQNFVYADVDGNIGYQMPGRVPIRAKGDGSVPVPGTGDYEWLGWIPYDELPRTLNPAKGYVVTANNAVVPPTYKYFISKEWAAPYRAMRIEAMIKAKGSLSVQDMRDIQADVTTIPGQELAGYLRKLAPPDDRVRKALAALQAWDGRLTTDTVAGSIVEATMIRAMRNTFGDELGELMERYMGPGVPVLLRLLPQADSPWWDNVTTEKKETRDDILLLSLNQALDDLTARLGNNVAEWQWGRLHTATFAHPLGSVQPLNLIFNKGPYATGGSGFTPDNAAYNPKTFAQSTVPSYRQIVDLSDLNKSLFQHTTGQSGNPFSKHYADFIEDWVAVRHHPMYFSRADVEANQEGTLILLP